MQPFAPLSVELRESAVVNLVLGDLVLIAAAIRSDEPGWSVLWFAVVTLVLALVWSRFGPSGRIRKEAPRAAAPPDDAAVAGRRAIRVHLVKGLLPVAIVLAFLLGYAPESAAVLAGVPAAVGSADLWMLGWVRKYERHRDDQLLRELGASAFAAKPRTLYTRPMNDVTDPT